MSIWSSIKSFFSDSFRPDPALPKAAESERIRYPFCVPCGTIHHPDHWQCKVTGGPGAPPYNAIEESKS